MIDHSGIHVSSFNRAIDFYTAIFAPLDIELIFQSSAPQGEKLAAFAPKQAPNHQGEHQHHYGQGTFWLIEDTPQNPPCHFAFRANSPLQVDAFYEAALKMGGKDNGKPGLRPHYHEHYYAAFVFDFDGHNIEAVCHGNHRKTTNSTLLQRQ